MTLTVSSVIFKGRLIVFSSTGVSSVAAKNKRSGGKRGIHLLATKDLIDAILNISFQSFIDFMLHFYPYFCGLISPRLTTTLQILF